MIGLVQLRLKATQADLDSAREARQWSQLPGLAGIVEGLEGSLGLIRSTRSAELRANAVQAKQLVGTLAGLVTMNTDSRDQALAARRYADVPSADGRATGYLMAVKLASVELGVAIPDSVR